MYNIYQLENFISSYKTYEEVEQEAKNIDKFWRESSWTRALRKSQKIKAVYKGVEGKSPIIGYKPKNASTRQISPNLASLDDILKEILKTIPASWENQHKISEIQKALKAKYDITKISVIKKYGRA